MFSRRVTCKNCGLKGVVEAYDTKHLPKERAFLIRDTSHISLIPLSTLTGII